MGGEANLVRVERATLRHQIRYQSMNTPHQVHIQIDGHEPKPMTIQADETIASLLARLRVLLPGADHEPELFAVFTDDDDGEVTHDRKFCECAPRPPKIIHCHRCRKIAVTVYYNGEESKKFSPNAKIRRITEWAKKKFGLDEGRKWVLRLGAADGEILDSDTHIGKLVKFPDCNLSLYLTERCLIQG